MPVIVAKSDHETWLQDRSDAAALTGLLKPATNGTFAVVAVSTFVNSPAHEGPDCVKPMQP
jgi:putative SOS response-associated peptidase YedK